MPYSLSTVEANSIMHKMLSDRLQDLQSMEKSCKSSLAIMKASTPEADSPIARAIARREAALADIRRRITNTKAELPWFE